MNNKRTLEHEAGLGNGSTSKWKTKSPTLTSLRQLSTYFGVSIAYLIGETDSPNFSSAQSNSNHSCIPVLQSISVDFSPETLSSNEWIEYQNNSLTTCPLFAFRISSIDCAPRISPNDLVIVRCQNEYLTGDTVLVQVDDQISCMQYVTLRESFYLIPFTSSCAPLISERNTTSQPFRILGRVAEVRRKL